MSKRMMYGVFILICFAYAVTKCIVVSNSTDVHINQRGGEPKLDLFDRTVHNTDTMVLEIDTIQ